MARNNIYLFDDFLAFLKAEYAIRCDKKAQYTQTDFAKELGLTHSSLSEILNRRHGVSVLTAKKIAAALSLSKRETTYFCDLVEMQHARARETRNMAAKRVRAKRQGNFLPITMSDFANISDFYGFVVVEGLKLSQRLHPGTAPKIPGMSEAATSDLLENLKEQNLIEHRDGVWRALAKKYRTPDEIPSEYGRKFHVEFLQNAIKAIDKQSIPQREFQTCVLAIPKNKLSLAKRRIKDFVIDFETEFSEAKQCDSVYALGLQFFNALNQ